MNRRRIAEILQAKRQNDPVGTAFDWLLIALILLNVVAVVVATVGDIQRQFDDELFLFEVISVMVFSLEYLCRVWSSVEFNDDEEANWKTRVKYIFTPMALIDLAAILPFFLGLFVSLDLRVLRIVRLIRVAKLSRYSSAMQLLLDVFRKEHRVLMASLSLLLMLMIIASSGIYLIEHSVQPQHFGSIPQAMWWAMATLTTVGYGDVTPITPLGKFFAGTITVLSMAMVALPAGILASSFSDQLRKKRDRFRAKVKQVVADGVIDSKELNELEALRKQLGIDREDAEELFALINFQRKPKHPENCPHCGKSLN